MSSQKSSTPLVGDGSEFLRTHEVANKLKISQRMVMQLMRSGKLPGFKIGRVWLVKKSDLEQYLLRLINAVDSSNGDAAL